MKVKLYLDKRSTSNDGRHPIKLYVNNIGKFLISTGYFAAEDEWKDGKYIGMYTPRNVILSKMIAHIENYFLSCAKMSDKELRENIESLLFPQNKKKDEKNFIYYIKDFISTKRKPGTILTYEQTIKKIEKFDPDCTLETIDRKWLINFENWLAKTMSINARSIPLRNIRAVFNYCIDGEITTNYPFRRFSIKKEETVKRALTVEQLRMLRDYPVEPFQEKYRDIFMLMFYLIGINLVDLFSLTYKNIIAGRIVYHRAKTNKLYSIKIEPEAQVILDKYKGENKLIGLPYTNYKNFQHQMDNRLKKIGPYERVGMGGKKVYTPILPNITSYASRHTWATLAYEIGTSKDIISQGLGHNIGSEVTSIYIKTDLAKVDAANRKVIDFVNQE